MKRVVFPSVFVLLFAYTAMAQTAQEVCAINIGEEVPSASITTTEGKKLDIADIAKEQPTIILFYRGGWCPYCTRHLTEIRNIESDITDMGYRIIAISPDDINDLPETTKEQNLTYTLYSDRAYNAMEAFGIAFTPSEKRLPTYAKVMKMKEEDVRVPVPAVFVVKDGVIQYRYVNPNYSVRLSGEMLLAALKSISSDK